MAIQVHLAHLAEALERGPSSPAYVLDASTGEIDFHLPPEEGGLDEDEEIDEKDGDEQDDEDSPLVFIPQIESGKLLRFRRMFAESLDEPDVRERLLDALDGKGAFRRFRDQLDQFPDIEAHFAQARLEWIAANWDDWLQDVAPGAELVWPVIETPKAPAQQPGKVALRLVHVLLLGQPGKEAPGGECVVRVVQGRGLTRRVFAALARELCETKGNAWRKAMVEGKNRVRFDDTEITWGEGQIEVRVDIPAEVRTLLER